MADHRDKRVAVVQSNYIPWKGYFDLINLVDEFILFDDVQYTRRDWRNRNIIKTPSGLKWLTIPVQVKEKYFQKINETKIHDPSWGRKHWATLVHNYARAKYFYEYSKNFEPLYLESNEEYLSQINFKFIETICRILGITTKLSWSREHTHVEGRTARLIALCKSVGGTHYISGPSGRSYIDEGLFEAEGIRLSYMDYSNYPMYFQLHGAFEHGVTILDLIFNEGNAAPRFMKSFGAQPVTSR